MRWRIAIISLIVLAVVVAAAGHFLLGWWQPARQVVTETSGGYNAESQAATLPGVLGLAHDSLKDLETKVHDYSATVLKRERIGNTVVAKWAFMKFREHPFSVYLYFLEASNEDIKGREVIYFQGHNDNNLRVHTPGFLNKLAPGSLPPNGLLAMMGEHYPITEIGLANLCRQLIKRGDAAGDPSRVEVKRFPQARLNGRACTLFQVIYPFEEKGYWGYLARIFVDDEYHFPTRVEVYGLPLDRKKMPQLEEEYTYLDVKLNRGYTDADFDPKNKQYKFPN